MTKEILNPVFNSFSHDTIYRLKNKNKNIPSIFPPLLLVGLFPLPFCSIRSAPGNYGNVAGRCQDVGSLEVGVQLRPPPVFITAGLPSPHRGPGHAGSVFPNRERSDSPLRFQNKPQSRGEGGILTLKALFEQVFSTRHIHFSQKMCVHGSVCV